ncbi:DUF1816 domain-containing protein [Planktothrix sp. FACHB-1355]|uniref:DUF1816 domain-containing protein n=1 Tax=Aerosakkonema funiforme FACHB-1375 TaxID=2949571 RepID=A0A926VPZ7_9CYAN|nr:MULTISPECIES: DUF1816 domain-containing protein [Oscillatoriales]MBD2186494.1 DUF1816 domain-containing protein [Aerosakkonema funiforme FACHB-1375]MBD3562139.1 DUF1816 domain-containing protein [Planktothrix sp. FACHB-1355]
MLLTNRTLPKQEEIKFGWWVKIVTLLPECTYYIGPFNSIREAAAAQVGYMEDLKQEGAQEMTVWIRQCKPKMLTSFED